jgi:hypothetical protein
MRNRKQYVFGVALTIALQTSLAAQTFSEWTAPVNAGSNINTSANEV